jgi:DMSO/TMAO reductase YedYZ molybdopterin-dependent catalytic subunit
VVARLPKPAYAAPAVTGADFGLVGLTPYFTPNGDFYRVDTSLQVPQLDARTWELRIDGMVENPVTIRYADLLAGRLIERDVTLTCVSNEVGGDLVGNARWLGLPIRDLLAAARPKAGADAVRSHSVDGWTAGTPLSALTDPGRDAMLAIGMNGVPLPAEHGYPVRMVVPGLYGYVSATKWVTRLEVTRFDAFQAYWTRRGWAPQGPVKTESRIDLPRPYGEIRPGRTTIAGVAWAQHRGIAKVEVQVDDGAWQTATLAAWDNPDTWRQWRLDWTAPRGTHNLTVRATDGTGAVQTAQITQTIPDGATGYDTFPEQVSS